MTAYVNQLSGRRELQAMAPGRDHLVQGAGREERYDSCKKGHSNCLSF
jgi:hypothetical protein